MTQSTQSYIIYIQRYLPGANPRIIYASNMSAASGPANFLHQIDLFPSCPPPSSSYFRSLEI
jgi:hypothetical protein